jgi:2-polyprenyl-3-methyl-5-hydroxy-6-metoxy-1,4-benzoquinol methylase
MVTALEVVEHMPDAAAFLRVPAGLVAPGGLLTLT